jgi:hypothetical protein
MTGTTQISVLANHGGFPNGYLLQAWPSAKSPQPFIKASNSHYLTFKHE